MTGLVPLHIAARVAYFQLSHTLRHATAEDDLASVAALVAVALSTVAPIRRADGSVLSDREVHQLFFGVRRAAALEGFVMRRADLKDAIVQLRQARAGVERRS